MLADMQYASQSPLCSSSVCPQMPAEIQHQATPNQRRYRSAVALNNAGVLLLERQCYIQAVDALKHASALLQSTSSEVDSGKIHVTRSLQHLSHPRPARKAVLLMEALISKADGSLVQGELTDASVLDSILGGAPSSYMTFPIRLEDCESVLEEGNPDSSNFPRQAAVVSHNLGIALLCRARTVAKHKKLTQRLLRGAIRFAQMSLCFWMQQLTDLQPDRLSPELYCFAIVSLNSLIQVFQENSQRDQAIQCYGVLAQLRFDALELLAVTFLHKDTIRKGPAAAIAKYSLPFLPVLFTPQLPPSA
jgi:hypothetical protein